jgi:hypothetical protein
LNEALKVVGVEVVKMARESCLEVKRKLKEGTVISLDGSWDHRRNGSHCFVAVLDQETGKVITFIVMGNKVPENHPNYCRIPQGMERAGMERLVEELMACGKISGYVHDNDAKIRKLIKLVKWDITEFLDPGHAMKSFQRILNKVEYKPLEPLQESLRRFMFILLKGGHKDDPLEKFSVQDKLIYWQAILDHYREDHRFCPFGHNDGGCIQWEPLCNPATRDAAEKLLQSFVDESKWILEKCDGRYSTQANEALNRLKVVYANKDVKWWVTYVYRMACVVLDRNKPFWKIILRERLGLPLSPCVRSQMMIHEERRLSRQATGSEAVRRSKKKRIERAKKMLEKVDKEQKKLYRGNPYESKKNEKSSSNGLLPCPPDRRRRIPRNLPKPRVALSPPIC